MKLLRLGPVGAERPVLLDASGSYLDLTPVTADIDPTFFAAGGIERVRDAHASGELPAFDGDGMRVGAPVAKPGALLCIGVNYAAHAAESGATPPPEPVMFYKATNTLTGPDDDIPIPRLSAKTDWEVELAVVIGRKARYLESPEEALGCVAGYSISNDLSEREFQLERSGGQWSKGKSCEGFNPMGPWLVTADEVSPQELGLRSWVNGEPRQDSSTSDMIFSVAHLVWHLSQFTVLDPGDVINTGTPQGVALSGRFPYLKAGDVVEMEIDGLGRQRGTCVPAV
jgi:2,4-didehydro-3-deoxy-L-rhamnonate hydrolase